MSKSLFAAQESVQVTKTRKNAKAVSPAKAAEAKTKAATKAAEKVKAPAKAKAKAAPAAKGIAFTLMSRPSSGKALIAHTQAVFILTGLIEGASADKKLLRAALGDTALSYHRNKFQEAGGKLSLSEGGRMFFSERFTKAFGAPDSEGAKEAIKPFIAALGEGKASDSDFVRNAAMFVKTA